MLNAQVLKFISLNRPYFGCNHSEMRLSFNSELSHNNTIEWSIEVQIVQTERMAEICWTNQQIYENGFNRVTINDFREFHLLHYYYVKLDGSYGRSFFSKLFSHHYCWWLMFDAMIEKFGVEIEKHFVHKANDFIRLRLLLLVKWRVFGWSFQFSKFANHHRTLKHISHFKVCWKFYHCLNSKQLLLTISMSFWD